MTLEQLVKDYKLDNDDIFQHKNYKIITRSGIEKIQAKASVSIQFESITCTPEYCAIKATATKGKVTIQTFGSAKYGGKEWLKFDKPRFGKDGKWIEHGNTTSWYIMEIAEKRAMSRAVLKITGFYELGVFGEDESEDFKRKANEETPQIKEAPQAKQKPQAPAPKKEKTKDHHITTIATKYLKTELLDDQQKRVAASFIFDMKDDGVKKPFMSLVSAWQGSATELLAELQEASKLEIIPLRAKFKAMTEDHIPF